MFFRRITIKAVKDMAQKTEEYRRVKMMESAPEPFRRLARLKQPTSFSKLSPVRGKISVSAAFEVECRSPLLE
ncbi:hypothetical protein Y032_0119g821 [Ancylostoma ceylanicum]|nr:hypothetical protein Y032_0119g821 [Ancylostoma ceylanicum]